MPAVTRADFIGTGRLTRLGFRRDRYTLAAWWLGLGVFVAATSAMFNSTLAAYADLVRETQLVAGNAGMRLLGLASGPTIGGYLLHREFLSLAVLAALMSTFTVIRHTRQDEELGRSEVLDSAVVGRYSGLAAAVLVAVVANIVLALFLGTSLVATGQPLGGSLLAGASVAGVGLVWVGVAAVTCQLSSTTRGAAGLAAAALAVAFVLAGIGNMRGTVDRSGTRVTSDWPSWLSPIGWGQQTRPFAAAYWWPLLLVLGALAGLVGMAAFLVSRRDVGRGLWPERRGHAVAPRSLRSPAGLVWRLQRSAFLGWAVALAMFGLIFGNLTQQIQGLQGHAKDWWTQAGGTSQVIEAYQVSIIQMAGMFVAIYVVQVLLRMRVDEAGGTMEPLLAAGVTRTRWLVGHVVSAMAGSLALMMLFGASMGVTAGLVLGHVPTRVRELMWAALVQLPAVWVVGAAVVAVACLLPRWAVPLSWGLMFSVLVAGPMFGPSLNLPALVQDLSPFTHSPKAPAVDITAVPVIALMAVAAALALAGLLTLRRRDLSLPV